VEAGVGRGERRRARGVVQMLARGGARASWSARGGHRRWGGARWRRGVPAGGTVGGEADGACRPAWGPRREATRVGFRLGGSSGDGRGVGGSSDEEGGVGVAGIHNLVTGS